MSVSVLARLHSRFHTASILLCNSLVIQVMWHYVISLYQSADLRKKKNVSTKFIWLGTWKKLMSFPSNLKAFYNPLHGMWLALSLKNTSLRWEFSQILFLFWLWLVSEISVRKAVIDIQDFPLKVGMKLAIVQSIVHLTADPVVTSWNPSSAT